MENTEDIEKLITENLNLANKLAWEYRLKLKDTIEYEELQSICYEGLVKAANTFDKRKQFEFSTYAYTVMRNELLYFIRQNIKHKDNISFNRQLTDDLEVGDIIKSNIDVEEQAEIDIQVSKLKEFIKELPKDEQFVIDRILAGDTIRQIAVLAKVTVPTIYTRYKKALNRLRFKLRMFGGEY